MAPMQPMAQMEHRLAPAGHPAYSQAMPAQPQSPSYAAYQQLAQYGAPADSQAAQDPASPQQQWAQPATRQAYLAEYDSSAAERSRTASQELPSQQPTDDSRAGIPQQQPQSVFVQQWAQSVPAPQGDQAEPALQQRTASADLPQQQPAVSQAAGPAPLQQPRPSVFASQWAQQQEAPAEDLSAQQHDQHDQQAPADYWQPPSVAVAGAAAGFAAGHIAASAQHGRSTAGDEGTFGNGQPAAQPYGGYWRPPTPAQQPAAVGPSAQASQHPQAWQPASPGSSPRVSRRQVRLYHSPNPQAPNRYMYAACTSLNLLISVLSTAAEQGFKVEPWPAACGVLPFDAASCKLYYRAARSRRRRRRRVKPPAASWAAPLPRLQGRPTSRDTRGQLLAALASRTTTSRHS